MVTEWMIILQILIISYYVSVFIFFLCLFLDNVANNGIQAYSPVLHWCQDFTGIKNPCHFRWPIPGV